MKLSAPIYQLKQQAKRLKRETAVPLTTAQNQLAQREGYRSWSHLMVKAGNRNATASILQQLKKGDLVLLGARPGQGKTLLALDLLTTTAQDGRQAFFFTLDYHVGDIALRMKDIGADPTQMGNLFSADTSDDICADYIVAKLGEASAGTVVVIDYLQILDQRRDNPSLDQQLSVLKAFAQSKGITIVILSQIDRSFELTSAKLPGLANVRLPNKADLSLFTKTCFTHDGQVELVSR